MSPSPTASNPRNDPLLARALDPYDPESFTKAQFDSVVVISDSTSGASPGRVVGGVLVVLLMGLGGFALLVAAVLPSHPIGDVPIIIGVLGAVIGVVMLAAAVTGLKNIRHLRGSYIAVGRSGLTVSRGGRVANIAWEDIAAVQVAVLYSRTQVAGRDARASDLLIAAAEPGALIGPKKLRTQVNPRIRLAPVGDALADRKDLKGLVLPSGGKGAELPFTHHILLFHRLLSDENNVPPADLAALALYRFAGHRFAGIVRQRT
jgi:hypothetical protein